MHPPYADMFDFFGEALNAGNRTDIEVGFGDDWYSWEADEPWTVNGANVTDIHITGEDGSSRKVRVAWEDVQ